MSDYKRVYLKGGCYFFTLVTRHRKPCLTEPAVRRRLREAIVHVRRRHPLTIDAFVLLPDHLHCIWRLPEGDDDFSTRWRLIKHHVSRDPALQTYAPIWQPRFWEHAIRGERDWRRHMDYIHYNPVRHGLAKRAVEWPHSSFSRAVESGYYDSEWGSAPPDSIRGMFCE